MKLRWRRSSLVWDNPVATYGDDDWTLVDTETKRRLGRIFNARREDGFEPGKWRWRVFLIRPKNASTV